jgi:hypothetical protein
MCTMYSNEVPTLHFEDDRWALRLMPGLEQCAERPEFSDWMLIRCAWTGETWFTYRFIRQRAGRAKELITFDQLKERLEAIIENEGEEAADIWMEGQDQVEQISADHPVFQLQKHWEAMIQLGLFFPTVNNRDWVGIPLNEETANRMAEARDRYLLADLSEAEMEAGGDVAIPRQEGA